MAKAGREAHQVVTAREPAFTRSQVEWALWHHAADNAKRKPTRAFAIRVKHLLEFDRTEPVKAPAQGLAFSDQPPGGRGEHSLFSAFDTLMLAAGLGFLQCGFKRKEVVTHLRVRRPALQRGWVDILDRRLKAAVSDPKRSAPPVSSAEMARVMIHATSLDDDPETLRALKDIPFYSDPRDILKSLSQPQPNLVILDLSYSAHYLPSFLLKAPLRRRGRS